MTIRYAERQYDIRVCRWAADEWSAHLWSAGEEKPYKATDTSLTGILAWAQGVMADQEAIDDSLNS